MVVIGFMGVMGLIGFTLSTGYRAIIRRLVGVIGFQGLSRV